MKNDPVIREKLHQTALKAPLSSGVYIWRDENNNIIYVGKAKILKNRLSSYFAGEKDIKTKMLVSHAYSIEYITTTNEYEALILENTLIKEHTPKYNINLKDDKSYPVLRITNENFPRIFKTRRIIQDGSVYYGPFPNVGALDDFLESIKRIYTLRQCKKITEKQSPCMYYHIGRCKAPCCKKISKESYNEFIEEIKALLEGNQTETLQKLESSMLEASKNLQFEKAARLRDGINALKNLNSQSTVSDFNPDNRDYIGFYSEGSLVSFIVLKMRNGHMVMKDTYRTKSLNTQDILLEFLMAYYTSKDMLPPKIYIPIKTDSALFRKWTKTEFNIKPEIFYPKKNDIEFSKIHNAALNMAMQNAHEDIVRRIRERGDMPALEELQKLLKLDHVPSRIEGFDIAHIGGNFPVASLISFYNGNPDKKNYRYFRLKTTDGLIDDFASMREATSRRYTRLLNEQQDMPDLILIDGGIGQVNAVEGVLNALNLNIPVIGLAKQDEEIYLPGNSTPISLPKRSDALRLLQRVRDETHRFATSKNQKLRTKQNIISIFEELPYVGKAKAKILLDTYGTLENLVADTNKNGLLPLKDKLLISLEKVTDVFQAAQILLKDRQKRITKKAAKPYGEQYNRDNQTQKDETLAKNLADQALNDLD